MSKYTLYFATTIRGSVTVEAESQEEAEQIGEEMAQDTVSHDDMEGAPNVETEFEDIWKNR